MSLHSAVTRTYLRRRTSRGLQSTDVFLVGHPKSGNTLMSYGLALLTNPRHASTINLANLGDFVPAIHGADWLAASSQDLPRPRIFRNEWPVFPDLYPKVIYVVRDPRAALVSYYHHYRRVTATAEDSMSEFVDTYLRHGCIPSFEPRLQRWDRQVADWLDRSARQSVLLVRYEDLVADRRRVFMELAEYVGVGLGPGSIDDALRRTDFRAMQALEDRHGVDSFIGQPPPRTREAVAHRFVRRGEVSGWTDELGKDDAERISSEFGDVMRRLGYDTQLAAKCGD